MDLTGKNVLITGASRGIGEALAQRFAQAGAHVVGVARNAELLGKVMADVGGAPIATDLGDPAQVDGLIARVERDTGPVDVLVNNAGLDMVGALVDTKAEDIRTIHQVNLVTPVELGPIPTDMLDHVNDYSPTRNSFDRFYKLQMLVDVPRETVACEVVAAVQKGRRHVRIPKRALAFPMLNEAPRRIIETLLVGVRSRP